MAIALFEALLIFIELFESAVTTCDACATSRQRTIYISNIAVLLLTCSPSTTQEVM